MHCWRPPVLLALFLALAAPVHAETSTQCIKDLVCMEVSSNEDHAIIFVSNRMSAPAAVQIKFHSLNNISARPSLSKNRTAERVIPPGETKSVVTLIRNSISRSASFPFEWSFSFGDPRAIHNDDYRYRIPFGGKVDQFCSQGANGKYTHKGDSAWSFDFAMPIGTPIVAARPGRVVEITDGYTKSGISEDFLDKANAVTVMHDDGTFATYAHLDPGSGVREGMLVNVGDIVGFSGNTGFSTGPHLHFSVWKSTWQGGHTIPIRFHDGSEAGFLPKEDIAYQPTCHADGIPCKAGELPAAPASMGDAPSDAYSRQTDGTCLCKNGAVITTKFPCRMVCP